MRSPSRKRASLAARENPIAHYVPYSSHLDERTIKTNNGDYLQVIRVGGFAHESVDEEDVVVRLQQLNVLYRNIAGPEIALWVHLLRRYEGVFPGGDFEPGFADDLNNKYRDHLAQENMMITELYITVVYRPLNKPEGFFSKFEKYGSRELEELQEGAIEGVNDVVSTMLSGLQAYSPRILSTYTASNGVLCSEPLEFFAYLINGEYQRIPVTRNPVGEVLGTTRQFFGQETMELRMPDRSLWGACLAIKEYPEETEAGMLNALLSAQYPLVLSQSYVFMSTTEAVGIVKRQRARMINAGDLAASQIESLDAALDDLVSGRFVMGYHSLSLLVIGDDLIQLKGRISDARAALSNTGSVVCREDLALESAFWAQLPGNFRYRTRPAPITSRNFAALASLHNFPCGRLHNNQWGDAVTKLKTSSSTPYYFNFHEESDNSRNGGSGKIKAKEQQKSLGNTTIIGPAGSGKTVVLAMLLAQSQKYKPTCVVFDKDRGLELFVRAMGGNYSPLVRGAPTGFNPFQLEATPRNMLFLEEFTKKLCKPSRGFTVQEEEEIGEGVRAALNLSKENRRLSSVLAYINSSDPDGAGARLKKWCSITENAPGNLAWAFDNVDDTLDFSDSRIMGFDITEFLDDAILRTPMIMYLFHRMKEVIDGRRFIAWMDEFWKLLLDEYFEGFANDELKTIRKKNGFLVLSTQSPKDVLRSPISHSIIEQCPTMIFLPNPKADPDDYVGGFKLSHREFSIIKEGMPEGAHQFLVKQGQNSVVAELDLKGFDDELSILSGNTETVALAEKIIDQVGGNPAVWVPLFQEQRKL